MVEVPPELQSRLRAEAARLDADAPPISTSVVQERRAPKPRSTAPIIVGAAIMVLVATVVGVSAQQDRGGRVRATNTSILAVPAPATTVTTGPMGQVLRQPPPGSRTVDYHGFRMFLPSSWQVVEDGCP